MGVVFEMPVVMMSVARVGLVSSRMMRQHWRISIVALAVFAMLLPGVDPISYVAEFIPLLILYGLSYFLVSGRAEARRGRPEPRYVILAADWVLPVDGPPVRGGR